jgi:tetratricopeptide (TPR) repeat protein
LEESLALSREIGDQMGLANTLHTLSWLFGAASEPEKAWRFGKESLTISRLGGHTYQIAHALNRLGATAFVRGDYAAAVSYCREGLSAFRQLGDRYGMALMLAEQGRSMYASGIYPRETFLPLLEEGAALSRDSGNYVAMYPAIGILGKISNLIGEYEVGQRCGQELLDLLPGQSYPYLSHCLIILGWAHLGQGNYQDASHYLRGALAAALKDQPMIRSIIMWALLASAHLLHAEAALPELINQPRVRQQKQEQALGMVVQVLHNPQAWPFWKQHAAPLAAKLEALLPPEVAAAALAQEMELDLTTTTASVLAELERDSI